MPNEDITAPQRNEARQERSTALMQFTGLDARGIRAFRGAGLGWGLDGMDWMMYSFVTAAIMASLSLSTGQIANIASLSLVMSAIGGVLGGFFADRYGRARVLVVIILAYSVATALCATAQDFTQLAIWRSVAGAAFGAEWAVGAAMLAEFARNAQRGRVMGLLQSCYAIGWAGAGLLYVVASATLSQDATWRVLFLIGLAPALLAAYVRRHVHDNVQLSRDTQSKFSLLFRPTQLTTTLRATILAAACQSIYYSVFTFLPLFLSQRRGLTVTGASLYVWIAIFGSFCGYVCAGLIHDRLGRRLTFSLYFIGSCLALLVFLLAPVGGIVGTVIAAFPLGFFAAGQTAGLGAYLAELHPTEIRATGQAFAYSVGRGISGLATTMVGGVTAALGLGGAIAAVGIGACTVAILLVWTLPETNGIAIVGNEGTES
ncbi:MFS transporter [Mycolicibacterium sp.]|uniref:MFS transporter n=1 Tax=Mycolicibacterium sp. TaxID=2320850 RepID=UPI003D0AF28D